jgi:hypothetical protein
MDSYGLNSHIMANLTDTIICQPTAMFIISKRALFVHIAIMKDKRLF